MKTKLALAAAFVLLVAILAVALWGTVVRPRAYEVRGQIVARPAGNLLLVRHEAVGALAMPAMELMAVFAEPALLDGARLQPGQRARLAVRRDGESLHLLRIEPLP